MISGSKSRLHIMDFRLSSTEEGLRKKVDEFVRDELVPLEPEFLHAPDIFEGAGGKAARS